MQDRFNALLDETRSSLSTLVDGYTSGYLDAQEFGDRMAALLEDAHTDAVVIGRQHAGDDAPPDADDRKLGEEVVDGESEFLASFVKDLEAGMNADDIRNRADMYADKLVGTANESWALAQDGDVQITWNLSAQNNCQSCIDLADGSPYAADALPTTPGAGDTECITRCGCFLTNDAGQDGFKRPDTDEE